MGSKYTTQSASGFNSSAPSDDGTASESNKVKWSTILTKLASPLKTLAEAINSQLVTTLNTSPRAVSVSEAAAATDHWRTIQVNTPSVTITLADAATMAAGYIVDIANQSTGNITVALASSTDTIDTVTNTTHTLSAKETRRYIVNAAASGYITAASNNDYTTGTWTPSLGGTATYTTQTGTYTKIGRLVHVTCQLTVNAIGSGSATTISGLPFAGAAGIECGLSLGLLTSAATASVAAFPKVSGGTSTIVVSSASSANATVTGTFAIFQNGTVFQCAGTYHV